MKLKHIIDTVLDVVFPSRIVWRCLHEQLEFKDTRIRDLKEANKAGLGCIEAYVRQKEAADGYIESLKRQAAAADRLIEIQERQLTNRQEVIDLLNDRSEYLEQARKHWFDEILDCQLLLDGLEIPGGGGDRKPLPTRLTLYFADELRSRSIFQSLMADVLEEDDPSRLPG